MTRFEHKYDIASTYYFRHTEDVFRPEIMRMIVDMGHEIGFHYKVIDKAKGNAEKAIEIFTGCPTIQQSEKNKAKLAFKSKIKEKLYYSK